ncbi:hypothetical protein F5Y15DRAFT_375217 [Xylariaceae sp. FL0016]|nr:hypothetical protein F5Y15DRAFT_375217 [Xylariaceae sp. FL0016]
MYSMTRRRWLGLYYGLLIAATLILVRCILPSESSETWRTASSYRPSPLEYRRALAPGEYLDQSRMRISPEEGESAPLFEPDGPGTGHDQRNDGFYRGGVSTLTSKVAGSPSEPVIYDPYPDYNSRAWRKHWKGEFFACEGPQGTILNRSNPDDMMTVYHGTQSGFPFPPFGTYDDLGLDGHVCADRCVRYGAYGHQEAQNKASCRRSRTIQWDEVNWGNLQTRCVSRNSNRFRFKGTGINRPQSLTPVVSLPPRDKSTLLRRSGLPFRSRTAVVMRTVHNMKWTENHKQYVRSLIMELALHSGGEYELFLLVDVKDLALPLNTKAGIQALKNTLIPSEFRDIAVLFNEAMLASWYPKVDEHRPVYQHLQPMQIFAQLHPNFDHYWQFEMDSRNTGHAYHFLEQVARFAKKQPRKYLWERNSYFYTPGAHGSWSDFSKMVDRSMIGREAQSVWGPVPAETFEPIGPMPPVASPLDDNYQWGVGEEADLITLLPIFDVRQTAWTFPDKIWGVPDGIPRRASPITMWRMSFQLLDSMHKAQKERGQAVVSEMSGPTWALLHGLKAVHVPHPIYVDGQWTAKELASIVNPGEPDLVNGGPDSIWNWNHAFDHIMFRMSYMFTTQTAEDLFRRWLGFPADPNQYTDGSLHEDPQGRFWYDEGKLDEEKHGRLCYPLMLLHTVKNTEAVKGKDMAVPV